MAYSSITDFLALLRTTSGGVRTSRIPGLDYIVAALARMGLCALSVGATAPTANQATTVWLQPASPSWSGEGAVFLWNNTTSQYQLATPALWSYFLCATFLTLIPAPSVVVPYMDNSSGAVGVSNEYAKADHVHPTDTSRAPLASPVFTGTPQAPTPTFGDNSQNIATTAFVQETAGVVPPIGSILPYSATTPPSGNGTWVVANGQAISRTTYSVAFGVMGINFGSGDGISTFNVPDLRGRVVAGIDGGAGRLTTNTQTSIALAGNGGSELVTLTSAQIPPHTHPNALSDPGHTHTYTAENGTIYEYYQGGVQGSTPQSFNTGSNTTGISLTNASNTGGGGSHSNVQPTMQLQYIIRIA